MPGQPDRVDEYRALLDEDEEDCKPRGMTRDEALKCIEMLEKKYGGEENALKALYVMYQMDKLSLDDLRAFTGLMGYEFTDEFEAMSEKDKKIHGLEFVDE